MSARAQVSHGVFLAGCLSAGDEDDRHLVPRSARSRHRNRRRRAHDREGDSVPRARDSRRRGSCRLCSSHHRRALLAALLVAFGYREGPYPFARAAVLMESGGDVVRVRRVAAGNRRVPRPHVRAVRILDVDSGVPRGECCASRGSARPSSGIVSLIAFGTIAVGGAGCVWGGLTADRLGRERLVTIALAASGTCCLLVGFLFGESMWLLAPLALVWGFFVVADSAQFSALVTESVPPHAVGTALTIQTSIGFLLTMFPMQLVPALARASGWRWSFAILVAGPRGRDLGSQTAGAGTSSGSCSVAFHCR